MPKIDISTSHKNWETFNLKKKRSEDMTEAGIQDNAVNDDRQLLNVCLEKVREHRDLYFPDWRCSGKTYMIPPAPRLKYCGPTEKGASGYDEKIVTKKEGKIKGDLAEAKVHAFLAKSNQHAFVLQGCTNANWRKRLRSLGFKTVGDKYINGREIFEFDFLILHAYIGIIAVECKGTEGHNTTKYSCAKNQLKKVGTLIECIKQLLEVAGRKIQDKVPVKKVVSFPSTQLEPEEEEDIIHLDKNDLENDPQLWWNRLKGGESRDVNLFQKRCDFYEDVISILLALYTAVEKSVGENVMDIYNRIDTMFFKRCPEIRQCRKTHKSIGQIFFLNPEQVQVLMSEVPNQFVFGEVGTGKTILLTHKALFELGEGGKVVIMIPKSLDAKYRRFLNKRGTYLNLQEANIVFYTLRTFKNKT